MRIAVCDDNKFCRINISKLLNLYSEQNPQHNISVLTYEHADDLINAVKKTGDFDIYILDIIMPDTNGVELGVMLRKNGYDGKIIYLTSSEEHVFDSFKAHPFNYILKPVEHETLFSALDTAIADIGCKKEKSIIVKTSDGNVKLPIDSIMYAELVNRIIVYHLANGKTVESNTIRTSFGEAAKELINNEHFVMCGASFVVNLLHITTSKSNELVFRDGSFLKIPRKLLADLRTRWMEYWLIEQNDEF